MMKGAATRAEKIARIRAFFKEHPTWVDPNTCPEDKRSYMAMFIHTIGEEDDADHIELMLQAHEWPLGYAKRHPDEFVQYLARLGREKTFAQPDPYGTRTDLFITLRIGSKAFLPLVENWIKEADRDDEIESLVYELKHATDGQQRLLGLLADSRPKVTTRAASWLRSSFPDRTTLNGLRDLRHRRGLDNAPDDELSYLSAAIKAVEESVNSTEHQKGQQP